MEWLPVLRFGNDAQLGVRDDGEWVVEKGGALFDLRPSKYVPALPLLQMERGAVMDEVRRKTESSGVAGRSMGAFPVARLLETALRSQMDFWAARAIEWIEPADVDADLLDALQQIQQARWASQFVRGRARKVIRALAKQ
ncbi:hypothetical protein [Myxococcus landrumensis]|uniref:Uncharacterized protein n=1 Tax=Myxococcus landrumensis TaxID=2813577 RepID=A0ABX7N0Y9_9BACT|nr:hypothetical protein [Myxococcus landrumus]QSQ12258.1 hypothetical protein JY572_28365 [Myxococcus landrumus]